MKADGDSQSFRLLASRPQLHPLNFSDLGDFILYSTAGVRTKELSQGKISLT